MTEQELNKKFAEILVECGYAVEIMLGSQRGNPDIQVWCCRTPDGVGKISEWRITIEPFANTFEGMKQANAIEDYFEQQPDLWDLWNSFERPYVYDVGESMHDWRLDRIRWCTEQLKNSNER